MTTVSDPLGRALDRADNLACRIDRRPWVFDIAAVAIMAAVGGGAMILVLLGRA